MEHKLKNILRARVPRGEWQSWEEDLGMALEKRWWTELYGLGAGRGNVLGSILIRRANMKNDREKLLPDYRVRMKNI